MAVKSIAAAACLLAGAIATPAAAQSITGEADISAGQSTDRVTATAFQVRFFGPIERTDWRMYAEIAWGAVQPAGVSDAFDGAYPYDRRVQPMEIYAERTFRPRGSLFGVRAGHYRTPFGISSSSDHAYSGFLRAPLIRYGENWALSNTFFETGVDVMVGKPSVYAEASVGAPQDPGPYARAHGVDTVLRTQAFFHSVIAGASYIVTQPNMVGSFVQGRMKFSGVDGRWMRGGVQLRGEWVFGQPFNTVHTQGGYLDAIVHRLGMGPLTAVARVERLDYDAGPFSQFYRRMTAGARLRLSSALSLQVNVLHQPKRPIGDKATAADAGLTYSIRF
jgi:hypothetical protein